MKVWQVEFPDNKVQVPADGVTRDMAAQVMIDFMAEHIRNGIEEVTLKQDIPVAFSTTEAEEQELAEDEENEQA